MVIPYEAPDLRAALCDELHPGGAALTDEMLAAAALPPGAVVADIGCGAGIAAQRLREYYGFRAVGIDLSAALLAAAHGRDTGLPLLRADAARLPLAAHALDAALAECVLSTLPDPDLTLAEFHRVLKPGGLLLASDICAPEPQRGRLSVDALPALLGARGFALEQSRDRSEALKVFAARLIFAGISPAGLGCGRGRTTAYRWYVARKT